MRIFVLKNLNNTYLSRNNNEKNNLVVALYSKFVLLYT